VNFYEFNKFCRGDSLNLDAFYQGIYKHEGLGTTGLNGHQSRNEVAAIDPVNDPHTGAERMVQSSSALLTSILSIEIQNRDLSAFTYGLDHDFVNNNWCGSVWILKPSSKYFFSSLKMSNGLCF
jgi:hypothetical protein